MNSRGHKILLTTVLSVLAILTIWKLFQGHHYRVMRQRRIGHQVTWTRMQFRMIAMSVQLTVEDTHELPPKQPELFWLSIRNNDPITFRSFLEQNLFDSTTGKVLDPWKNPVRLRVESKYKYTLISSGPNGKDDNGTSDDIVFSFDPWKTPPWKRVDNSQE